MNILTTGRLLQRVRGAIGGSGTVISQHHYDLTVLRDRPIYCRLKGSIPLTMRHAMKTYGSVEVKGQHILNLDIT